MQARPPRAPPVPAHPLVQVLSDEVVWDGRFPLQRVRFTYTRFDGATSAPLTWELWRRGGGVVILPYDPVADAVGLIEQFRLPALAAGFDPVLTECPAGLLEPGEASLPAARREVAEETGLEALRIEPFGRYLPMHGGCDETLDFYCAEVRVPALPPGLHGLAAEGESTRLRVLPAADAFALLDGGGVSNVVTGFCLQWLRHHRPRLRAAWTGPAPLPFPPEAP